MHDTVSVEILYTANYLNQIFCSLFLIKRASPQNLLIEIMEAVFHNQKHLISSYMVPIGRKDIRMLAI